MQDRLCVEELIVVLLGRCHNYRTDVKAKWRVCGESGSAKLVYTKLVHQNTFRTVLQRFLAMGVCWVI